MDDTPFTCGECDFRFGVIWCRDYMTQMFDKAINNCPRCGSEDLKCEEPEE